LPNHQFDDLRNLFDGISKFLKGSFSEVLDDLLGSEFFVADGKDFLRTSSQAFLSGTILTSMK
jgi:hypothetical protein